MKQILSFLSILLLLFGLTLKAKAMDFSKAIADKKPSAVLLYADWADDSIAVQGQFNGLESEYGNRYHFVKLNIASPETKAFNKTYHIYPNLPYILLFKDKAKTTRAIAKDCILDNECIKDRLDIFLN